MFPDPEETPDQEWKMVSRSKTYVPTEEDVGYTLKVECTAKDIDGSTLASKSTTTEVYVFLYWISHSHMHTYVTLDPQGSARSASTSDEKTGST